MQETVKRVRRGSVVYTDKWGGHDSLMFCVFRHLNIDHEHKFKQGKVYINGIEGFWSFAKERLIKHHGSSRLYQRDGVAIQQSEERFIRSPARLHVILGSIGGRCYTIT
jgi:hypothetical protein